DLDSETLDLLEVQLVSFAGTLLVVSHDRTFLNNVVTSTIVFEDDGLNEYVGGYDAWRETVERRGASAANAAAPAAKKGKNRSVEPAVAPVPKAAENRLSFKEQKELKALPARIESI